MLTLVLCLCILFKTGYTRANRERLSLDDDRITVVSKLSQGNPGAMRVLMEFMETAPLMDPDAPYPFNMLIFDMVPILGPNIWLLYKDVCSQRIECVHTVTRSLQLGLVPFNQVRYALDHRGVNLDVAQLLDQVQEQVPAFLAAPQHPDPDMDDGLGGNVELEATDEPQHANLEPSGKYWVPELLTTLVVSIAFVLVGLLCFVKVERKSHSQ